MAGENIRIVCWDPAAPTNLDRAIIIPREVRSSFSFTTSVPGGDTAASWDVNCDYLRDVGYPLGKARILVDNPTRGTYLWRGVLKAPEIEWTRGMPTLAHFEAIGCAEGSFQQFPSTTVFGVTDTLSTVNGRQVVTNLGEIMAFGLTQCPLIDGPQSGIENGGVLVEDTRDYRGQIPPVLWEDVCIMTRGLGTPFIWVVEPDPGTGLASLRFYAETTVPTYFEHGNAKSNKMRIDYGEIANQIYGVFGASLLQHPPAGDPIDYTQTPDLQTHFVDASTDIQELSMAQGFVESLYQKFNQRVPTGGTIILDRPIRTRVGSSYVMLPFEEVRAGRAIETEITKVPYLDSVVVDLPIRSTTYDEDACQITLSQSPINEAGKNARMLAMRAEQAKLVWGTLSRGLGSPHPDLEYVHMASGTNAYDGFTVSGWSAPSIPSAGQGSPTVPSKTLPGRNPLPTPVTTDPPDGAQPPPIVPLIPVAAANRDGYPGFGFGAMGYQIVPQMLPGQRINIPAQIPTFDPITGDLGDGERMQTDVQEAYIDTVTLSTLGGVSITVTVKVDIWNWDLLAVRVADAFTINLVAANAARLQFDNSDAEHMPILLYHGDQLRWKVQDADTMAILHGALNGWKSWKEFPVLVGPDSIPGNS